MEEIIEFVETSSFSEWTSFLQKKEQLAGLKELAGKKLITAVENKYKTKDLADWQVTRIRSTLLSFTIKGYDERSSFGVKIGLGGLSFYIGIMECNLPTKVFEIYNSKEVEIASQLIKSEKYHKLIAPENIYRIDSIIHDTVFMEEGNYTLGTQYDGHFSEYRDEFTWFAFRKTEELASQIEEKINRYIFSDEMTQLIKAINQEIKHK
ncbi:hypothetical protein N9R54_04135 [Pelobium sp.]|nr:hypothetical protein [Pelobium sp.]MDA9555402.1 hypothetical protein [Pelobium sp.]